MDENQYSDSLKAYLDSNGIWHRFIVFRETVRTVEQAARRVEVGKIAKSIVMVDSTRSPLLVILPAGNRMSQGKVKKLMNVKDVRPARE